eukprot:3732338-Pyramimonas_sp.AAC.1
MCLSALQLATQVEARAPFAKTVCERVLQRLARGLHNAFPRPMLAHIQKLGFQIEPPEIAALYCAPRPSRRQASWSRRHSGGA